MRFVKKQFLLNDPELFNNFFFKRTKRQYVHLMKVFIFRIYRLTYKFLQKLKWK